jgi:hypothetical protein
MPALVAGIYVLHSHRSKSWMAGTLCAKTALRAFSPAMTKKIARDGVAPPSPRAREYVMRNQSRGATAPGFLFTITKHPEKKGAERREAHSNHVAVPCRENGRALSGALAFRRSAAALVPATERRDSVRAALHASGRMRALPAPSIALKRGTSRPGHSAGGA